jgi:hypothetical protein
MSDKQNRLGVPSKSPRLFLFEALVYLIITIVGLVVFFTHSFGNSLVNLASNFWLFGIMCVGNVAFYLNARNKYEKQRRLVNELN